MKWRNEAQSPMATLTIKKLESWLKRRYKVSVGQFSLEKLRRRVDKISKTKIRVSGRSYKTGNRKTVNVTFKDLLGV